MPSPILFRGLTSLQQPPSRLAACSSIDDDKIGILGSSSPPEQIKGPPLPPISTTAAQHRSCQEARRVVREAMTQSAVSGLISQPNPVASGPANLARPSSERVDNGGKTIVSLSKLGTSNKSKSHKNIGPPGLDHSSPSTNGTSIKDGEVVCMEIAGGGAHWKYVAKPGSELQTGLGFQVFELKPHQNPFHDLVGFIRSCIVPEGYPESVAPSYAPYMQWRALKYFFGGAMSVFTTRSLLHSVGVSGQGAASTAVAVNWVIKDGAGRIGKMLFARHGKKFDCDMKQLRFTGDLMMELGAGIELATVAAPQFFLPLACAANIAKNVAAVTSTSTRAPIYKAFARGENIGDVTAKGECISNIADLLGTGLGIFISKRNPSLLATFAILSFGYLSCSYQEAKSVLLPTLNKARFGVAVQSFLDTGQVLSVIEGNRKEGIFVPPWGKEKSLVLGARVNDVFQNLQKFLDILPLFQNENYLVTYNLAKRRAYVLLKEKASSDDVIRATFHAQVLVHILKKPLVPNIGKETIAREVHTLNTDFIRGIKSSTSEIGVETAIKESCKHISRLYEAFRHRASSQGWIMDGSLLNPGNARLCSWKEGEVKGK